MCTKFHDNPSIGVGKSHWKLKTTNVNLKVVLDRKRNHGMTKMCRSSKGTKKKLKLR